MIVVPSSDPHIFILDPGLYPLVNDILTIGGLCDCGMISIKADNRRICEVSDGSCCTLRRHNQQWAEILFFIGRMKMHRAALIS